MKSRVYNLGELTDYKYVVVFSRYNNQWLLCKHKERDTWETAGGHIDSGESPEEAARRELREETGAKEFDLEPVCDYWACSEPHEVGKQAGASVGGWANGVVFLADIQKLGDIPESEMEKIGFFDTLQENLGNFTYPDIYRELIPQVLKKRLTKTEEGSSDLSISQLMEMQRKLHSLHTKEGWKLAPENARTNLLWMMEEVGEVVSVVKKNGNIAVLEDSAVRAALIEEASDLLFYLTNALLCYEISPSEWAETIRKKNKKNMKRSWSN